MPEPVSALTRELLAWISSRPRTYADAMDAWRSNCPRHAIWEDALADGLIRVDRGTPSSEPQVALTPRGRALLDGEATGPPRVPPGAHPAPPGIPPRQRTPTPTETT